MNEQILQYKKWQGIVTTLHQWCINTGRITVSIAVLSEYVGPLKWFKLTDGYSGQGCRWSRCIWVHRVGFGIAWDFIGLK